MNVEELKARFANIVNQMTPEAIRAELVARGARLEAPAKAVPAQVVVAAVREHRGVVHWAELLKCSYGESWLKNVEHQKLTTRSAREVLICYQPVASGAADSPELALAA